LKAPQSGDPEVLKYNAEISDALQKAGATVVTDGCDPYDMGLSAGRHRAQLQDPEMFVKECPARDRSWRLSEHLDDDEVRIRRDGSLLESIRTTCNANETGSAIYYGLDARTLVNTVFACPALRNRQRWLAGEHLRAVDLHRPTVDEWLTSQPDGFKALVAASAMADEVNSKIADTPIAQLLAEKGELAKLVGTAKDSFRRAKSFGKVLSCHGWKEIDFPKSIPIAGTHLKLSAIRDSQRVQVQLLSSRDKPIFYFACDAGIREGSEYWLTSSSYGREEGSDMCNKYPDQNPGCVMFPFVLILEGDKVNIEDVFASIKR
jgi:hypothetical protein